MSKRRVERHCPDCKVEMSKVRIVDKTSYGGDTSLEYALADAERSLWGGDYPKAGYVRSFMCPQCGRIILYGAGNAR